MDNKNRESERKRIKDMINKIETEEERDDSYEQAADLSSLLDADPEPVMIDSQEDASADDADTETAVSLADLEDSDSQEDADPVPASEDAAADTSDTEAPKETSVDDAVADTGEVEEEKVTAADDEVTDADKTEAVKTAAVEDATPDADADVQKTDDKRADAVETKEKEKTVHPAGETAEAVKEDKEKKDWLSKIRSSKRNMIIAALVVIALLVIAVTIISHLSSLSGGEKTASSGSDKVDAVTYTEGDLTVNNVSVSVPTENATYNIAYDYGQDDVEYPTVPYSANAVYFGKDGKSLYDISLRKESFTRKADIPDGKDASNWFSDWVTDNNENNLHAPKDSGSLHGFIVSTAEDAKEGEAGTTYGSVSYYFALQDKDGLSVYALECVLYDKDSLKDFRKVMDDSINSIRTK